MKENKKDPFTNVTNAERLSPEDRDKLLKEAYNTRPVVEVPPPAIVLIISDILTVIICTLSCYLIIDNIASSFL